jgi:predicted DCC family thiol-disulfide oxidoreductase YuxK
MSKVSLAIARYWIGFGAAVYFLLLAPYAPDLMGGQPLLVPFGVIGIPNPFSYILDMATVKTMMLLLVVASILLMIGYNRRVVSILLLAAFFATINAIPLFPTPMDGFAPFAFLLLAIAPINEKKFELVHLLLGGAWIVYSAAFPLSFISVAFALSGALYIYRPTRAVAWILSLALFLSFGVAMNFGALFIGVGVFFFLLQPNLRFPWQRNPTRASQVIYIDGECVLCHGFAETLLEEDIGGIFQIASLEGNHAAENLPLEFREEKNSVVLKDDQGRVFTKSTAVLRILSELGGIWSFSPGLFIVPKIMRDLVYDLVAKIRYRIFGRYEFCRLPNVSERARLLD